MASKRKVPIGMVLESRYTYCALIAVIVLANVLWYTKGTYIFGGEQPLSVPGLSSIYSSIFLFTGSDYSGIVTPLGSPIGDIYFLLMSLVYYATNLTFSVLFQQWLLPTVGSIGVFLLVARLTERYGKPIAYCSALLAAVLFSVHLYSNLNVDDMQAFLLPYLFICVLNFAESLESGKGTRASFLLLALVVSIQFSLGSASYALENSMLIFLIFIALLLMIRKGSRKQYLWYCLVGAALVFLINLPWIYSSILVSQKVGASYLATSGRAVVAGSPNIIQALLFFGPIPIANLSLPSMCALVLVLLMALVSIWYFRKLSNMHEKIAGAVFAIFLAYIPISSTISAPFGPIFSGLLGVFPYLYALRFSYVVTHYIYLFIVPFLFGLGVAVVLKASTRIGRPLAWAAFAAVILLLCAYLYLFDYLTPASLEAYGNRMPIPGYVTSISDYINSQPGSFAVAALPLNARNYSFQASWYSGINVYSTLISQPVYTGASASYYEDFFPGSALLYSNYVGTPVEQQAIASNLSNGFGVFGIRYIIVQGDAIENISCGCTSIFSFNAIYSNLNSSPDINFVGSYGNSTVYENRNYVPLVYASNAERIGSGSPAALMAAIMSRGFDIQATSVFSNGSEASVTGNASIHPLLISRFSAPNVSFIEESPTSIAVNVSNATTPYYIVFRETYDPGWTLQYQNGTTAPQSSHVVVNGFANAWYMDKPGSYRLTIYYSTETGALTAFAASAVVLIVLIAALAHEITKRSRHAK